MKKLVIFLLVSLLAASTAYAELEIGGSYFIKGTYSDALQGDILGLDPTSTPKEIATANSDNKKYESDFEVKAKFVVDENTYANLVVETFDHDWNDPSAPTEQGLAKPYLQVTEAILSHTFTTGTTFNGGFDGIGQTWGTAFGDRANDAYFLKVTQALPMGSVVAWTEKIEEVTDNNGKEEDTDAYGLGAELKVGELTLMPAVYYVDVQSANNSNLTEVSVAAVGAVAGLDIEAEFIYSDDEAQTDANMGFYASVSKTINSLTVNVTGIYTSDDGDGFDMGTELGLMEQITDDFSLAGSTLLKAGADYAVNEKLTVGTAVAYNYSNIKNDDTVGYEIGATASYAFTNAVSYSAGVSYLDGDDDTGKELKDASVTAYNTFNVAF